MDLQTRVMELAQMGYECSQILMMIALDLEGKSNPDLIRAVSGLSRGMRSGAKPCGCLSGGACVLGLYGGKGEDEEIEDPEMKDYIGEYVSWFEATVGSCYGGTDCFQIVEGDFSRAVATCLPIMEASAEKLIEMIEIYDLLGDTI